MYKPEEKAVGRGFVPAAGRDVLHECRVCSNGVKIVSNLARFFIDQIVARGTEEQNAPRLCN